MQSSLPPKIYTLNALQNQLKHIQEINFRFSLSMNMNFPGVFEVPGLINRQGTFYPVSYPGELSKIGGTASPLSCEIILILMNVNTAVILKCIFINISDLQ